MQTEAFWGQSHPGRRSDLAGRNVSKRGAGLLSRSMTAWPRTLTRVPGVSAARKCRDLCAATSSGRISNVAASKLARNPRDSASPHASSWSLWARALLKPGWNSSRNACAGSASSIIMRNVPVALTVSRMVFKASPDMRPIPSASTVTARIPLAGSLLECFAAEPLRSVRSRSGVPTPHRAPVGLA